MVKYIKDVHGFQDENITILLDDDEHERPTKANIVAESGDSLFCHYSGHGCKIRDDDGDEADGYDEALAPVDYNTAGLIRDDDLLDILVKPLPDGVFLVCLFDCCHSGTILDLPYHYKPGEDATEMEIDEDFDFKKLLGKFGQLMNGLFD
jgi:hypothetical protein